MRPMVEVLTRVRQRRGCHVEPKHGHDLFGGPAGVERLLHKGAGRAGMAGQRYVGWQAGSATLMIGPHSEVKGRNEMPGRIIVNFETSDVQGEFERIKGLGAGVEHEPYQPGDGAEMWLATLDRKSTRLNSSHVRISYA